MIIGYCRCSDPSQNPALQIDALTKAGAERIFSETISGTAAYRPELEAALTYARAGDVLVVHSLSRIGRNVRQLIETVDQMTAKGIALQSLTEAVDTTSPSGRLWLNFLSSMHQFEVEQLRMRTRHGLAAARARGRVGGRPRSLDDRKLTVAKALIAEGTLTIAEVANQVGCAPATLYRALPGGRSASAGWSACGAVSGAR
jgi:DNA invertase Pin-like site-specific DNA recombinase